MAASHRHQQKRHGRHQRHTRNFLKVYSPYLPLMMIVIIGLVLSLMSPPKSTRSVLAYATSMSASELLASTNQYRADNGLPALKINSQLSTAAQNKANDMVARDYWSHVTPDGQQPWVFITNAGYKYQAAAENLAYGFSTSDTTVQGWMNSPDHRANMLNSAYSDVGFAYANSANYVGTGQETVVVAEYGEPAATASPAAVAAPSAPATTKPAATQAPQTPAPATPATNVTTKPTAPAGNNKSSVVEAVAAKEPATKSVSRVNLVTGSRLTWLASAAITIALLGVISLLLRHVYALHKWLRKGEKYVLKHFTFDFTIIALIGLCIIASQSVGLIK